MNLTAWKDLLTPGVVMVLDMKWWERIFPRLWPSTRPEHAAKMVQKVMEPTMQKFVCIMCEREQRERPASNLTADLHSEVRGNQIIFTIVVHDRTVP